MTLARLTMWMLALGLLAWALWLWPSVPARIPTHFGIDGTPDSWSERSLASWLSLPLVGLALAAGMEALTRWTLRRPGAPGLNIPGKEAILALPPERQVPVMDRAAELLYLTGVACLVAFSLIHLGAWTEANGIDGSMWVLGGVLVSFVGPLAALVWGLVRIQSEVARQQRR